LKNTTLVRAALASLAICLAAATGVDAQREGLVSVTGSVAVVGKEKGAVDNGDVAIWLKPVPGPGQTSHAMAPPRAHLKIVQRNKRFEPRVLVAPVGTLIDFPNLDPFFHNVFSLFDGKRFDLGLYEAGASRSVPFNTAGVCYIFCNIHPEMSAVVVVVDTPYYAVSDRAGDFTVANVPPGRYTLSVWHERHKLEHPEAYSREVVINGSSASLGVIRLIESSAMIAPHKNKYGHDYTPPPSPNPLYKGRPDPPSEF